MARRADRYRLEYESDTWFGRTGYPPYNRHAPPRRPCGLKYRQVAHMRSDPGGATPRFGGRTGFPDTAPFRIASRRAMRGE